jgi:methylenetetrahydrofolate dehydrogenase (NADP+)/methenyltetrahydrofolate cyclohydrolase
MGIRMAAKHIAEAWCEEMKQQVQQWGEKGLKATLAAVLVEGDSASAYYAQAKQKRAEKLGFGFELVKLKAEVSQESLLATVEQLNTRIDVHGIMVELPLPAHIHAEQVMEQISPWKDVDGVTSANKLACYEGKTGLWPATPQACIQLLKAYGYTLAGKHVVLIGRGETVGRPLMQLLLRENATLTVCHSRTTDLFKHVQAADIVITAAGRTGLLHDGLVHPDLIVIDAGINETDQGIQGDAVPGLEEAVAALSPVPGGVGTLTTLILLRNVLHAVEWQQREQGRQPSLLDSSVRHLLKSTASESPTPGGGSIAALTAALGGALGSMVANLSQGPKHPETAEKMAGLAQEMSKIMTEAGRLADLDISVFNQYMAALKLPKADPVERAARLEAIRAASEEAASVPLELMRCASAAIDLLSDEVNTSNPHVVSDLGAAVALLLSAVRSGWLTLVINTKPYPDEAWARKFSQEAEALLLHCNQLSEATLGKVYERIKS